MFIDQLIQHSDKQILMHALKQNHGLTLPQSKKRITQNRQNWDLVQFALVGKTEQRKKKKGAIGVKAARKDKKSEGSCSHRSLYGHGMFRISECLIDTEFGGSQEDLGTQPPEDCED